MRKSSKNWVCSTLRKESLGECLSSCTTISRLAEKKMEISFSQLATWKRHRVIVKVTSGEILIGCKLTFFTMRTINHWDNVPREVVYCPGVRFFKICLDRLLLSCLDHIFARKIRTRWCMRSFPTWYSIIL